MDFTHCSTLLAAHRTASLRHDVDLQATLLPLLLRNYLEHGLYEQADKLVSKTQFPEGSAQNSQLARWYYYLGACGSRLHQLINSKADFALVQAASARSSSTTPPRTPRSNKRSVARRPIFAPRPASSSTPTSFMSSSRS